MKGIVWVVLAVLLVACACQAAAESIRVSLDFFSNPNHIPLYAALDNGYFEDEGIEVDIFVPANPSDPVKLAAAGAVEIALTPQINYLIARSEGLPLIAIGALIDKPLGGLLALRGHGIGTIQDLSGKRIGYALAPLEPILWETVFECVGLASSSIELISVGFNTMIALVAGNVEAIGAFRNYEVLQLEELGYEPIFFPQEDYCVPTTYELLLVAHPNFILEAASDAAAFLRAFVRGIEWTMAHPEDALALFFDRFPELDDELNRRSFEQTLPLYAVGAYHADDAVWEAMQAYLVENGLMASSFSLDELYTDALLPIEGEE